MLQLVAGRLLSPFIGSSLATWTAVIGVFLAGISLGNWLGGKLADASADRRTVRRVLIAAGVVTLAGLAFIRALPVDAVRPIPLYPRIAALSIILCLPPAVILSLLTPLAIKLVLPDVVHTGRVVGAVYATGALGCLAGNFLTGFVLVALFPISQIVTGVGLGLIALGLFAPAGLAEKAVTPQLADRSFGPAQLAVPVACVIVFVNSFASMSLELAASRLLAPKLGVSLYSWTGIIGVVLAGTFIGNALGGFIADRSPHRSTLGLSLLTAGIASLIVIYQFVFLSNLVMSEAWPLMARIVVTATALFLLPMVAFGTISPQVTRLAVGDLATAGRVAGRVYAWSCAGAIAGTFASGWFLIGAFGTIALVFGIGLAELLMAAAVGQLWHRPALLFLASIAGGSAVGGLLLSDRLTRSFDSDAVYEKETDYYLIRVKEEFGDDGDLYRTLVLDLLIHSKLRGEVVGDKFVADASYLGYEHEQVQAELTRAAAELVDRPRVLVIGGGGYTLPRWVEKFVPKASVEVVEIDPGVTEAAHRELDLSRQTRVVSHHLDGRQFVQEKAAPGSYHLVIQDAVNDLSVPAHLMTKEYNDAVQRLLAPGGVYLLTVIDEYEDGLLFPAAIQTMRRTFPNVQVVGPGPVWDDQPVGREVFVIAGSAEPIDPAKVQAALTKQQAGGAKLTVMPADVLKAYLDSKPPTVLTDDFAPVDNLISVTYRKR